MEKHSRHASDAMHYKETSNNKCKLQTEEYSCNGLCTIVKLERRAMQNIKQGQIMKLIMQSTDIRKV